MPEKINHSKLHEDIGYIKRATEEFSKIVPLIQADLKEMKEKQDKMLGWASGVAAVVSVVFAIGKEFLGRILNGKT